MKLRLFPQILALAVLPAIVMMVVGLLTLTSVNTLLRKSNVAALDQAILTERIMLSANNATQSLFAFKEILIKLQNAHQRAMLLQNHDPKQMVDLRTEVMKQQAGLTSSLRALSSSIAVLNEPEMDASLLYLSRASVQLPRLLSFYMISNARTLRFVADAQYDTARSNFLYEEQPRRQAIDNTLRQTTGVYTSLLQNYTAVAHNRAEVMNSDSIAESEQTMQTTQAAFLTAAVVATICATVFARRSLSRPISDLIALMARLRNGDTKFTVPYTTRQDEIGEIAQALDVFRESAVEKRHIADQVEQERQAQIFVVETVTGALSKLAQGRLDCVIETKFPPSHEALRTNFNVTIATLAQIINSVSQSATKIEDRSENLKSDTNVMAERTANQAATLEEAAASLEDFSGQASASADGAREIAAAFEHTRADLKKGGDTVTDAVEAVTAIKSASEEISQVIEVIDDIAFQTNLLALNAGVEAARAGSEGAGFAAVASEVRHLAKRCTGAADEVKVLIANSTGRVETGVALVNDAGTSMDTLMTNIGGIMDVVGGIVENAEQQSQGIREISDSVAQLDAATQQSASMVSSTKEASTDMLNSAQSLRSEVARFVFATPDPAVQGQLKTRPSAA